MFNFFQVLFTKTAWRWKHWFRIGTGITDYLFLRNLQRSGCLLFGLSTILIVYVSSLTQRRKKTIPIDHSSLKRDQYVMIRHRRGRTIKMLGRAFSCNAVTPIDWEIKCHIDLLYVSNPSPKISHHPSIDRIKLVACSRLMVIFAYSVIDNNKKHHVKKIFTAYVFKEIHILN